MRLSLSSTPCHNRPMNRTTCYELLIRESHLDTFGHVNNAKYLEIFEEARWEAIKDFGFSLPEIHRTQVGPILLELQLKFLKELRLRQTVSVYTQMLTYTGKIGKMRQWIEDQKKQSCCEMDLTVGLFDLKARKLIAPTQEWLNAIGFESGPS